MCHTRTHPCVRITPYLGVCVIATLLACTSDNADSADAAAETDMGDTASDTGSDTDDDLGEDADTDVSPADVDSDATVGPNLPALRVVTFNTGTTDGLRHDGPPDDGYSSDDALTADTYYGNGLAYPPVIADTTRWFASVEADLVAFQEIFHPAECVDIPEEQWPGFLCETWQDGDLTVAQTVLGDGFQVLCHPGKPDKCVAVRQSVGSFVGCDDELCMETLRGEPVTDCGSRVRIAYGDLVLNAGPTIRVISVHGTSGLTAEDQSCRVAQLAQVRDAYASAPSEVVATIVLGDFNTDPYRFEDADVSAAGWLSLAADTPLAFISPVGPDAPGAYGGFFDIDHVLSDQYVGSCVIPGVDRDEADVTEAVYFDHHPVVCDLAR